MNNTNSHKLIAGAAISALMVISMLAALPLASGSHTATIDVTPKEAKGDSRTLFNVSVSNSSGSPDNIEDVEISTDGLGEPIAGTLAGENIENAGENLITASGLLSDAAGYMSDAGTAKITFAENIGAMKDDLQDADDLLDGNDNYADSGSNLGTAGSYLGLVMKELTKDPKDVDKGAINLKDAGESIYSAGDNWPDSSSTDNNIRENLIEAGSYLENAANNLGAGDFETAESDLNNSYENFSNAVELMENHDESLVEAAGDTLETAVSEYETASSGLTGAADNLAMTGELFDGDNIAGAIGDAGNFLDNITPIENAGTDLIDASAKLENVSEISTSMWTAGDNLENAGGQFETAGGILMKALGGDYLAATGTALTNAGENIEDNTMVDIGTAADQLTTGAGQVESAGDALKSRGQDLQETPAGWEWNDTGDNYYWDTDTGENTLAPGESADFPVLLMTGDSGEEPVTVYTTDTEGSFDDETFTITVDNEKPSLSARVYQSNVGENNLVGNVYDNGEATVEITASETLSSLGTVKLMADGDNIMDLDVSSDDNMVYTGTFEVGEWDENYLTIWAESATDTYGLENEDPGDIVSFDVDTLPPVFDEDGLADARDDFAKYITDRAQSPENVWVTENQVWEIFGDVSDNDTYENYSNEVVVEALVNGTTVENASVKPDDSFAADDVDLGSQGLKEITLTAVDLVGNSAENSIENIFLDNSGASVDTVSPTDDTITNNNEIGVSAWVSDTGIGVENAVLYYDNINGTVLDNTGDNFEPTFMLENDSAWTAIPGDNGVWPDGEHTIVAYATDNVHENDTMEWTFEVDTVAPDTPTFGSVEDPDSGESISTPTDENTMLLTGTGEPESTIAITRGRDGPQVATTTVDNDGNWSVEITVDEDGTFTWYATATDTAGNTSDVTRLRTQTVDTTAPTVNITSPDDQTSTSKLTKTLQATVDDEITEATDISVTIRSPEYTVPEGGLTVLSDGSLSVDVPLREGSNLITVMARDEAGNVSSDEITVTRTIEEARNWEMYATIGAIIAIILAAIAIIRRSQ